MHNMFLEHLIHKVDSHFLLIACSFHLVSWLQSGCWQEIRKAWNRVMRNQALVASVKTYG